ncbi:hypothetical protein H4R19_004200 [Coemansia spiralis]|nr:hypothetical protein H4R19_004200 [Coemansia spiralis]
MKSAVAVLALAGCAAAYDIVNSASLNCRKQPTTKSEIVKTYQLGDDIEIVCQTKGQTIYGTNIWDATPDGCFVLDYYVRTGYGVIFKPVCQKSADGDSDVPSPGAGKASNTGSEPGEEGSMPDDEVHKSDSESGSESSEGHKSESHSHDKSESSVESSSENDSETDLESSGALALAAHPVAALVGAAIGFVAALF